MAHLHCIQLALARLHHALGERFAIARDRSGHLSLRMAAIKRGSEQARC